MGRAQRDPWLLLGLVVFSALLLYPGLGAMDAVFSTDARYLEISREMFETGNLGMPLLAGSPHLDKPPLVYWMGAGGYALLGPNPGAGRFFEQLALMGTALLVFGFGRRWMSRRAALLSAMVMLTSLLPYTTSRGLSTDVFQLLTCTGALLALLEATRARHPTRYLMLASGLLGASFLVKGPIAVLIVATVWTVTRLLGGPRLAVPLRARLLALLLALVIGAPWYVWLVAHHPEVAGYFVNVQLLGRLGAGGAGHVKHATFIVESWLWGTLPWTPLLLLVLARFRPPRDRQQRDPVDLLLWVWAVVPVILFSIPATKLPTYVLPALPPAALLLGRAMDRHALQGRRFALASRVACGLTAVLAIIAPAVLVGLPSIARLEGFLDASAVRAPGIVSLALLGVATGAVLVAMRIRDGVIGHRPLIGLSVVAALVLSISFSSLAPAFQSKRAAAELVHRVAGARVVQIGTFQPSFLFYFRDIANVWVADFRPFHTEGGILLQPRLTLSRGEAVEMMRDPVPTMALVKKRERPAFLASLGGETVWCDADDCLRANPPAAARLAMLDTR